MTETNKEPRGFPLHEGVPETDTPKSIEFTLTPEEWAESTTSVVSNTPGVVPSMGFVAVRSLSNLLLFLLVALFLTEFERPRVSPAASLLRYNLLAFGLAWAVWVGAMLINVGMKSARRQSLLKYYSRLARDPGFGLRLYPQKVEWNAEEIEIWSGPHYRKVQWPGITKVITDQSGILLHFGAAEHLIIPKRVFADEGTCWAFAKAVRSAWEAATPRDESH
jgi:hypothetical protein